MDVVPKNWNLPEKLEFSRNLLIFSSFSGPFLCVCFAPLTTSAATEMQLRGNNNCRHGSGFSSKALLRLLLLFLWNLRVAELNLFSGLRVFTITKRCISDSIGGIYDTAKEEVISRTQKDLRELSQSLLSVSGMNQGKLLAR